MKEMMEKLREASIKAILESEDVDSLEALRVKYLGKKGELTGILRQMGRLSAEERPVMGQLANRLRADIEAAIDARKQVLSTALMEKKLEAEAQKRALVINIRCITCLTRSRIFLSVWALKSWMGVR